MFNEKFLPIGSIVLIKGAKKKVMIMGYFPVYQDLRYDYSACAYPCGMISSKEIICFNGDNIELVYSYGYKNDEYESLRNKVIEKLGSESNDR